MIVNFRFPLTNDNLCNEWVNAIKSLVHVVPKPNHRICSDHFLKSDFTTDSRRRRILKKGSIPSVFNAGASYSPAPEYASSSPEYSDQEDDYASSQDYSTPYFEIKPEKRKIIQVCIINKYIFIFF